MTRAGRGPASGPGPGPARRASRRACTSSPDGRGRRRTTGIAGHQAVTIAEDVVTVVGVEPVQLDGHRPALARLDLAGRIDEAVDGQLRRGRLVDPRGEGVRSMSEAGGSTRGPTFFVGPGRPGVAGGPRSGWAQRPGRGDRPPSRGGSRGRRAGRTGRPCRVCRPRCNRPSGRGHRSGRGSA